MSAMTDIAIIGSGFAGSLLAWILQSRGLEVTLLERRCHPRFAIGESSSPIADMLLAQLARAYRLPGLEPLAKYGTWTAAHPEIPCGLKRGFSFFQHEAATLFSRRADHANELLVGASPDDASADTHWYRADFDHAMVDRAAQAGVDYRDLTTVEAMHRETNGWLLHMTQRGNRAELRASFVVDASGGCGPLADAAGLAPQENALLTSSYAIFGHFKQVHRWTDILADDPLLTAAHPFDCDAAALHHVFEGGWMWVLRFDHGTTSAGFVLPGEGVPEQRAETAWQRCLFRFPSIARQFRDAHIDPRCPGLIATGRLQRLYDHAAGDTWALLPSACGFVDPLFSTGNAHALCGVARLADMLLQNWRTPHLLERLAAYDRDVVRELRFIDRLIHGCHLTLGDFELLVAWTMVYFAAATTDEARRRRDGDALTGYLCADDSQLISTVHTFHDRLVALREAPSRSDRAAFINDLRLVLQPYNHVGLFDEGKANMYAYV